MANPNDDNLRGRFMEFPYVSDKRRELMVNLITTLENIIGSQLLPCRLPHDVQNFKNPNGTSEASFHIRSGNRLSPIDFVIGSWVHTKIPERCAYIDITTISAFLNSSTKAPNFVLELIQHSPTTLYLLLDLPHRKDLLLHEDYRKTIYEDTYLDSYGINLLNCPGIKSCQFSSIICRSANSPIAVLVEINAKNEESLDEILRVHVGTAAKSFLTVWLEQCTREDNEIRVTNEEEKMELERRDKVFRMMSIDAYLPFILMFGEEVSTRVSQSIKEAFGVV